MKTGGTLTNFGFKRSKFKVTVTNSPKHCCDAITQKVFNIENSFFIHR